MNEMFSQGGKGSTGILTNKQAIARKFGVKQNEVVYFAVGVDLGGYKVIYDKTTQRAYSLPVLPAGTTAISLNEHAVLVHSAGTVDLGELAATRREFVSLSDTFATGLVVNTRNELLFHNGIGYSYLGALPVTIALGTNPAGNVDWKPQTDPILRGELASETGSHMVGNKQPGVGTVATTVSEQLTQLKTLFDYGGVCDGVTDDSAAIEAMANDLKYVILPDYTTTYIATSITLPLGIGEFKARIKASLRIADGAKIFFTSPSTSTTQSVNLVYNQPWVSSSVDLTGKYLEITNGKTDYVMAAETATANTIDIMSLSKDDANFGTLRSCMFKVIKYDSVNSRAYLDTAPNFSAPSATAVVYTEVNHAHFSNIHFMDENTGTQDTDGVLRFRRNYGGGISNCTGRLNYPEISYFSNFNKVENNTLDIGYTFMLSWNCYHNSFSNNSFVTPEVVKDAVLIVFKNCCRNVFTGNVINGEATSGYHWGIIFHTHCDYNVATGNKVNARHGIGDYAFNKGNLITNNNIECHSLANMGVIFNQFTDNNIKLSAGIENTVSYEVDLRRNKFYYVGLAGTASSGCVNLYDVGSKPFGWAGFTAAPTQRLYLDDCEFYYNESRSAIDFTTMVDFTKTADTYIPSTVTALINGGVAGVFGYVQGTRSVSIKNCKFRNIHLGVLVVCVTAATNVRFDTGANIFNDVDCAYLVKSTALNNNTRGFESVNDSFVSCTIAGMTSNYPIYFKGATFKGVGSVLVQCGAVGNVYTGIIDRDCVAPNTGSVAGVATWYNFLPAKPSAPNYSGALTTTAVHPLSYRVPYGAEYYQLNADMGVAHTVYFVNRSTPSQSKTVAVAITETPYT